MHNKVAPTHISIVDDIDIAVDGAGAYSTFDDWAPTAAALRVEPGAAAADDDDDDEDFPS
jgi:hypothetical protein